MRREGTGLMLQGLLEANKAAILKRWNELILASYSQNYARHLSKVKDRFANPAGAAISSATAAIVDALLAGCGTDEMAEHLDDIVRVRAVQDFSPSQAVYFIVQLKHAVREVLADELETAAARGEFGAFESRIDNLILYAFDIYVQCREKMFQMRLDADRRQVHVIVERFKRMTEKEGRAPASGDEDPEATDER